MHKHRNIIFFCILTFCGLVFGQQQEATETQISLLSKQQEFVAGNKIVLEFETKTTNFSLYCTNSYGSILVNHTPTDKGIAFALPTFFTQKRGIVYWKVFQNETTALEGSFHIKSIEKSESLEMYLGPPSIEAGGKDFTMLVAIPTDSLDNPLPKNTPVLINTQFLAKEDKTEVTTNNLIAYHNIYAPLQSGRMLLSTQHQEKNSVELDVNIVPAIPKNFQIFFTRNHNYADGNQITTFYTSVLKDSYNNVVSDGTFVYFYITTRENAVLKTFGQTVNGVAKAKMIHPDKAANWSVKAFIDGISESNSIEINYQQAIKDFKVVFTNENAKIKVGPFQSFMNQMIPDGLKVTLTVSQKNNVVKVYYRETNKGFAHFILNKNFYPKGNYTVKIEAAGLVKTYKNIAL